MGGRKRKNMQIDRSGKDSTFISTRGSQSQSTANWVKGEGGRMNRNGKGGCWMDNTLTSWLQCVPRQKKNVWKERTEVNVNEGNQESS
jgi:hypothetical protein